LGVFTHLVIFILGDKYLKAVGLPLEEIPKDTKLIFITSKTASKNIPTAENYFSFEYGKNEAHLFSYGLVGLKGHLMKLLCHEISNNGKELLNCIYENPYYIKNILKKHER
jgi:hypothetical protein